MAIVSEETLKILLRAIFAALLWLRVARDICRKVGIIGHWFDGNGTLRLIESQIGDEGMTQTTIQN